MKMLGINGVIITNAAGGMNSTFKVGDFMILNGTDIPSYFYFVNKLV